MQKFSNGTQNIIITLAIAGAFFLGGFVNNHNRPEIDKVTGLSNKEMLLGPQTDFSSFWKVITEICCSFIFFFGHRLLA